MKHLSKLHLRKEDFLSDSEMKNILGGIYSDTCRMQSDKQCYGACKPSSYSLDKDGNLVPSKPLYCLPGNPIFLNGKKLPGPDCECRTKDII